MMRDRNRIPDSIVQEARDVPIRDVWVRLDYELGRGNANVRSPWREDNNASVQVGGEKNIVFDHGTGESFDTIALAQKVRGGDFAQAISFILGRDVQPERSELAKAAGDPVEQLATLRGWTLDAMRVLKCHADTEEGHAVCAIPMVSMFNSRSEIVGFKLRRGDGQLFGKGMKSKTRKGGHNGLFIPVPFPPDGPVVVCEGEADTLAALSAGHGAVVGTAGAGVGDKALGWLRAFLSGREVVLTPDPDGAGRKWLEAVGAALLNARCRVLFVPASQGDLDARLCRAPDKAAALRELLAGAVEFQPIPTGGDDGERVSIVIGTDEGRVIDQALKALKRDKTLYRRGGALVTVGVEPPGGMIKRQGTASIIRISNPNVRERLSRVADFQSSKRVDGEVCKKPAHVPLWLVSQIHQRYEWPDIPPLVALAETPVLLPGGRILNAQGYDPKSGVFLVRPSDSPIPEKPTPREIAEAKAALLDVVSDFPFAGEEHRAAWLAAVLTLFARPAIDGPCPMFLFDKNVRGAGGTLLADVTALIAFGRPMPKMAEVGDAEEERKRIASILLSGDQAVLIDNVTKPMGSGSLDAVLTGTTWRDRILGQSAMTPELPALTVWFATGNNVQVQGDLVRRVLPIRIESPEETPETRKGFRYPNLRQHVRDSHSRLASAALTLLSGFGAARMPKGDLEPWGSYEAWSDVVRGAVVWLGLPDPIATREDLNEYGDSEKEALETLFEALSNFNGAVFTSGEVVSEVGNASCAVGNGSPLYQALQELGCADRNGTINPQLVGGALKRARGRIIRGFRLEIARTDKKKGNRWRLVKKE
jgi:hypothetical protein